jgi:hypothetical protein
MITIAMPTGTPFSIAFVILRKVSNPFAATAAIGFTGIHRMIADDCEIHRRFEAAFTIP